MKITRQKKVQRFMSFFRNNYGFRLPYQILIDGTFCYAAKKNKINIAEQLPKYFCGAVKLLTTQCVIVETQRIGKEAYGALNIVKQYYHHRCGHEGKPVPASECLLGMLGVKNENRYIVATQDRELQTSISRIPGAPVLYLHDKAPTLQPPSETSTRMAHLRSRERFEVNSLQLEGLLKNKKLLGIQEDIKPEKKKRRKIRGPNPLSCLKKKKKDHLKQNVNQTCSESDVKKRKRKRVKIAKHVKEHFRHLNTKEIEEKK